VHVSAEVIREAADLDALSGEWRQLAVAAGNVFLTPEWFFVWAKHYGQRSSPFVVTVRDRPGHLVGLLPLARTNRTIHFAGANVGDWFGLLVRPGCEADVALAAARTIGTTSRAPLVLHNVDRGAPWIKALMDVAPRRSRLQLQEQVIPFSPLPASWEEFLEAHSRNFRSQVGRKERKLLRSHGARFRLAEDPTLLAADMKTFFALHESRWAATGDSTLTRGAVQSYHADFAEAALRQGWLRLWFLEADGRDVAAWYGWRVGDRYFYFNGGWDPAWSDASVGLVLMAHTIRSAIEDGATEYNFLLGDEDYKARFASAQLPVETVVLASRYDAAQLVTRVDRRVRRLADRLPTGLRGRLRATAAPLVDRLPGARGR
jgi:CelD/BcsL family acetyltransferase involved in cellulose biosynthesis